MLLHVSVAIGLLASAAIGFRLWYTRQVRSRGFMQDMLCCYDGSVPLPIRATDEFRRQHQKKVEIELFDCASDYLSARSYLQEVDYNPKRTQQELEEARTDAEAIYSTLELYYQHAVKYKFRVLASPEEYISSPVARALRV